ncbi:putative PIN and TRAM-domain containing protein YacL [Terrisporobacter mayombei]|uniref:PIN and TRAM-domain containing protein YacL n=1 Tax=Terrisporobacter mayombei TaxID=1541 RepID=A0ABY9Q3J2_9FIRM|nr:putative PIN and TRAM-domain containing protein YacL [Terrisporobacter mayombei]
MMYHINHTIGGEALISKIIRILISFLGAILGTTSYLSLEKFFPQLSFGIENVYLVGLVAGLLVGILFYLISPWFFNKVRRFVKILDTEISKYPQTDILLGVVGLIVGLVIAYLIVGGLFGSISGMPLIKTILSIIIYIFMGYVGIKITLKSREDLFNISKLSRLSSSLGKDKSGKKENAIKSIPPKVLDTSVIIDGRIADICRTGFVEGKLIIPKFVLNELQHIADSSDDLKRVRGRRGLDILNIIQKELDIEVEITEKDFDDIPEVDSKLLKLAQVMNGKVVTNDYNLNKVAQFQGVEVLNINELANAVKPVAIPGEEMVAQVVKEGKESNQGIAYLDDGTMIVVEGGRKHIGETINVLVTSVLQTSAGRMIFGKPKN